MSLITQKSSEKSELRETQFDTCVPETPELLQRHLAFMENPLWPIHILLIIWSGACAMWKFPVWFSQRCFFYFFFFVVVRLRLLNFLFISSLLFFLPSYFPLLFHSMSACFPSFIPSTVTRDSVLQALHWVLPCADTNVSAPGALPFLEHWPALKIAYCFPGFVFPVFWGFFSWLSCEGVMNKVKGCSSRRCYLIF